MTCVRVDITILMVVIKMDVLHVPVLMPTQTLAAVFNVILLLGSAAVSCQQQDKIVQYVVMGSTIMEVVAVFHVTAVAQVQLMLAVMHLLDSACVLIVDTVEEPVHSVALATISIPGEIVVIKACWLLAISRSFSYNYAAAPGANAVLLVASTHLSVILSVDNALASLMLLD